MFTSPLHLAVLVVPILAPSMITLLRQRTFGKFIYEINQGRAFWGAGGDRTPEFLDLLRYL